MLSIANISSTVAAVSYFEKDNYYAKNDPEHQANTKWFGKGSQILKLSGVVKDKDFSSILDGKLPNGKILGRKELDKIVHAPGIDLTFSAPKSVSIQAEVKGDTRIYKAHNDAVERTLRYVQDKLVTTRKMKDGIIVDEKVNNIIAATFRHNTSRNLDPQLHTHCVLANVVQRQDKEWRSANFKKIFEHKILLGQIYRMELANNLKELGYEIRITGNNSLFELKHIPDSLIKVFSTRADEIKKAGAKYKELNAELKAHLAKITRVKKQEITLQKAKEIWQNTLEKYNSLPPEIKKQQTTVVQKITDVSEYLKNKLEDFIRRFDCSYKHIDSDLYHNDIRLSVEGRAMKYAIRHLGERSSVWEEKEFISNALSYSTGRSNIDKILVKFSKCINKGIILESKNNTEDCADKYTTRSALEREHETNSLMLAGKGKAKGIASKNDIESVIKDTNLKEGQCNAVKLILTSKDRVIGVQGYAGTGKTTMLKVAKEIAENNKYEFHGLAPSSSAAVTLEKEAKIKSETLHKFLYRYDGVANNRGTKKGIMEMQEHFSNKVVIVDEASLAGTRQINALLKISEKLNFKVVLLGDSKQLEGVECGKPFWQLQKFGMETALMNEIVRQKNKKLLGAVYDTTKGEIAKAFAKLEKNIEEIENGQEGLADVAADEWLSLSCDERKQTLIVAPSNVIREDLNEIIREGLVKERKLTGETVDLQILKKKDLTIEQRRHAFNYKEGDVMIFHKNILTHGIVRNKEFIVKSVQKKYIHITDGERTIKIQPQKFKNNSVEVHRIDNLSIQKGEHLRYTRNSNLIPDIINSKEIKFVGIESEELNFIDEKGDKIAFKIDDPHLRHLDYAYAIAEAL